MGGDEGVDCVVVACVGDGGCGGGGVVGGCCGGRGGRGGRGLEGEGEDAFGGSAGDAVVEEVVEECCEGEGGEGWGGGWRGGRGRAEETAEFVEDPVWMVSVRGTRGDSDEGSDYQFATVMSDFGSAFCSAGSVD